MLAGRARRAFSEATNRGRKLLSHVQPYRPMGQGGTLLDEQYTSSEWDYLRSLGEAPRFGVVAVYCRILASGGSVLEVGCGEGFLSEHLGGDDYGYFEGIDISAVAIERAQEHADEKTTFRCADAESYVPERQFDLIVFNEVLEYFDDPLRLVRRYDDHLKPGGCMVVSMFAGVDTARTRRIWKWLAGHYRTTAHAKVATQRGYLWNIKVLQPSAFR
jgi:2-polyprenyl-3-methyl-5-hydroxy-6-metoxy-1,4-benzoquinol methylase